MFSKQNMDLYGLCKAFLLTGVLLYFLYHAISGDRGVLAYVNLSSQVAKTKAELDIVRAERLKLEHRVNLLRPESLDLDLLDEQARRLLGYAGEGETVYVQRVDED